MMCSKSQCICSGPIILKEISVRNLQKHRQPAMTARSRTQWETSDDMWQAMVVWHLMLHWDLTWVARLPPDSKVLCWRRWEIVVTFVCEANRPFKIKIFHMVFLIPEFIWSTPMKLLSKDKPMKKLTIMKFYNVLFDFSSSSLEHEYIFYPMPWLPQTSKYILHLRYIENHLAIPK